MELNTYKAQYFNKQRLRNELWILVKDIPKAPPWTKKQEHLLSVWKNYYTHLIKFILKKNEDEFYLYGLAFPNA